MNLADIQLLYRYNDWTNRLILAKSAQVTPEQFVAPTTHSWGSLRGTLVHILDTEWSWRVRCETGDMTQDMNPEDFPDVEAVRLRWELEQQAMSVYLDRLSDADMTSIVHYTFPGGFRERVLWHCLFHVVNHGMQHRSEAADMLTQYGQSPGDIDFTLYLLQK